LEFGLNSVHQFFCLWFICSCKLLRCGLNGIHLVGYVAWRQPEGISKPLMGRILPQLGAADKAENLVGCKSPYHQLPVYGWLAISDACGGNKACSARIKASAALQGICSGGNDLGGEQSRRPEHKGISAASKRSRQEVV